MNWKDNLIQKLPEWMFQFTIVEWVTIFSSIAIMMTYLIVRYG
jgi:hypothetical protein